jgi:hypothetical protein
MVMTKNSCLLHFCVLWEKKVTNFPIRSKSNSRDYKSTRFLSLSLFLFLSPSKEESDDKKVRGGASNERVPTSPFFVRWRAASASAAAAAATAAAAKLLRCVTGEENLDF